MCQYDTLDPPYYVVPFVLADDSRSSTNPVERLVYSLKSLIASRFLVESPALLEDAVLITLTLVLSY